MRLLGKKEKVDTIVALAYATIVSVSLFFLVNTFPPFVFLLHLYPLLFLVTLYNLFC